MFFIKSITKMSFNKNNYKRKEHYKSNNDILRYLYIFYFNESINVYNYFIINIIILEGIVKFYIPLVLQNSDFEVIHSIHNTKIHLLIIFKIKCI